MADVIFGLDIGTSKICALVGEMYQGQMRIIGVGIEPSAGVRKGMIINAADASAAIARAVEKAEQTSGYQLTQAFISLSGEHIACVNNSGVAAISRNGDGVVMADVERALDAAQAIPVPRNRQIVHILPRAFQVDDQGGVLSPMGMHGARLEVEAHIVTAATPALMNLTNCADTVGIQASDFVLGPLAAGEAVLDTSEKSMGVVVADIGGGTTDIALYVDGAAWHTKVIPVGGGHVTNDIAMGLRVPFDVAERVKLQYGDCRPKQIDANFVFTVEPFSGEKIQVGRQDLAHVIEARVEEIFQLILQEIARRGMTGCYRPVSSSPAAAPSCAVSPTWPSACWASPPASLSRATWSAWWTRSRDRPSPRPWGCCAGTRPAARCFRPRTQTGAWGQKIRTLFGVAFAGQILAATGRPAPAPSRTAGVNRERLRAQHPASRCRVNKNKRTRCNR